MESQRLTCPCGHSWQRQAQGPVPENVREICPVCTPGPRDASADTVVAPDRQGAHLRSGDRMAGFEIVKPLSRGGMGVVYKARQVDLNRPVALKVIAPERLEGKDHAEYVERFRREVRAAALLNHPNIVTVFATDLSGPRPYLAMEFVDGIDLYDLVRRAGPLGFADSAEYIRQAALGLQHAFERGLVHRDIKPHNLMVTPSPLAPAEGAQRPPLIKILDMGLARLTESDPGLAEGLTVAEAFLGTPDFAAPEQAEDSRLADSRADLYSLGATWFYLLTGEVPFPGVSLMQKLRRQLTQPTPRVTDHRPETPPALAAIILRLMDRDPGERFQTPAELADAIDTFIRDPSKPADWVAATAEPLVVQAHAGGVTAMCLNGDGRLLLTGGNDEALRVWEAPGIAESRGVSGNPGPVSGVAITGKGGWAASCALRLLPGDMAVQLWDLGTGVERRRLTGPTESLVCVAMTPDGRSVAAGDRNGKVYLWVLDPPGSAPRSFGGHLGAVTGLVFEPDGALLSVGMDGTLRRWDFASGRARVLRADAGALRGVAASRDTGCVALAGDRLVIRCPDARAVATEGHAGGTRCVAFSADGAFVASGGADGAVRLWRTSDGGVLTSFEGHEGAIQGVAVSPDRRFVYSGGADGTLRRWAVRSAALSARAP